MNLDYEAAEAEYLRWSVVDDDDDIAECRRQARLVVDAAVPEPCVHGNTGRHIDEDSIRMKDWVEGTTGYEDVEYDWCDGKPEADPEVIGFTPRELWATCCPMDPECDHSLLSNEELSEWMDHELTRDEIMDLI